MTVGARSLIVESPDPSILPALIFTSKDDGRGPAADSLTTSSPELIFKSFVTFSRWLGSTGAN